jgi:hypothetical protein
MTSAELYRAKALEFTRMASEERTLHLQVEYAGMAARYFRLAELAEKNRKNDLVYETPAPGRSATQTA